MIQKIRLKSRNLQLHFCPKKVLFPVLEKRTLNLICYNRNVKTTIYPNKKFEIHVFWTALVQLDIFKSASKPIFIFRMLFPITFLKASSRVITIQGWEKVYLPWCIYKNAPGMNRRHNWNWWYAARNNLGCLWQSSPSLEFEPPVPSTCSESLKGPLDRCR